MPPLGVKASPTDTITVTLVLQPNYEGDGYGTINATVTPPPGIVESDSSDNQAQAITTAERIAGQLETLFIVSGSRMATDPSQGASGVLTSLATLARHPAVKGAVLDVQQAQSVADAYTTWWASPASRANPDLANKVAETIRSEIQAFLSVHPNIRYLVFVGGDDIIPFYRVRDASDTHWKESTFARDLSPSTVRDALGADFYLTDDYYTDDRPEEPFSKFWPDARPFYVPDRISSRLVETPAEIQATVAAFLRASNHTISLAPGIIGGDRKLTLDTAGHICRAIESSLQSRPFCTVEEPVFADVFADRNGAWNSAWTAFHANQMVNGEVSAAGISSRQSSFDQRLWVSIGCHSGLNLPESVGNPNELDLVQSFVGKGGVAIAPTAYGYASKRKEPAYSELYMVALAERMLACSGQTVGAAFIQAKHRFFAEQAGWLDPLDEKAVLPVTLYGLPHWQLLSSAQTCPQPADAAHATPSAVAPDTATSMTASAVSSLTFTFTVDPALLQSLSPPLSTGDYYRYGDQTLAQDGRPIQPAHHLTVPETLPNLGSVRGLVLLDAAYHDLQDFDPVIEQAWIISALQQQPDDEEVEPPVELSGWDHDYPHGLGYYPKRVGADDSNPVARINLVLGACNAETVMQQDGPQINCRQERLFDTVTLGVMYSASDDVTAPHLSQFISFTFDSVPGLPSVSGVSIVADEQLYAAVLVCDDGQGHYASTDLVHNAGWWTGNCPGHAERLFVQAVDPAGNVTVSEWVVPLPVVLNNRSYLANVMSDYSALLPDLIATEVSVDQDGKIAVTIQNVGRGLVVDDFWVDLCFMNSNAVGVRPPSGYNDVCKGRSYDYLVWSVLASQAPILPGGKVILTQDQVNTEESVFERVIAAGTPIWVHVDSTNANTSYGGVLEEGEPLPSKYNNILGPVTLSRELYPPPTVRSAGAVHSTMLPVRLDPTVSESREPWSSPESLTERRLWLPAVTR
ncbi:MAG: hypothetical protein M9927_03995 [Anaerolineae bacterium]|nr:hypothetical protein [Anaerolineae bacterium]